MSARSCCYPPRNLFALSGVKRFIVSLLLAVVPALCMWADADSYLFSKIEGCSDPRIRSFIQLPDGRMAVATESGVDIFNGSEFTHIYKVTGEHFRLPAYNGYHHLYISHGGRYLWIKNHHDLQCIDTDTEVFSTDIAALLKELGFNGEIDDFFADSSGEIWIVSGRAIISPGYRNGTPLPLRDGDLLDLAADSTSIYLFYRSGHVECIDRQSGKSVYHLPAYLPEEQPKYSTTSHVVEANHVFYQIRNGLTGGFFRFDPSKRAWSKIFESDLGLNTLAAAGTSVFISTSGGLLSIDPSTLATTHIPHLRTESGNILASDLSTIAVDRSGSIWIGTVDRGIFYANPSHYRHFTIPKNRRDNGSPRGMASPFTEGHDGSVILTRDGTTLKLHFPDSQEEKVTFSDTILPSAGFSGEYAGSAAFISRNGGVFFDEPDSYSIFLPDGENSGNTSSKPYIAGILVNAKKIEPLKKYGEDVLLTSVPARTGNISLSHNQNYVTFQVTDPDYSERNPEFFYMLEGIDRDWREATASEVSRRMLTTAYTALPPGEYRFRVRLSDHADAPESSIGIRINPPWWATSQAYIIYALSGVLAVFAVGREYTRRTRRRISAEQREANLLLRIKQLIEEVDRYKSESPATGAEEGAQGLPETPSSLSDDDKAFIARAVEMVEQNLDTPGYSVVQLSADLCMDRTGLYRKLTALLDRSPSLFIRDIRLRKAASLLKEGKLSVTEIAEKTGFSTTSYMSKCFQERYGCRPSQYKG